jgi:hypothetical protein
MSGLNQLYKNQHSRGLELLAIHVDSSHGSKKILDIAKDIVPLGAEYTWQALIHIP